MKSMHFGANLILVEIRVGLEVGQPVEAIRSAVGAAFRVPIGLKVSHGLGFRVNASSVEIHVGPQIHFPVEIAKSIFFAAVGLVVRGSHRLGDFVLHKIRVQTQIDFPIALGEVAFVSNVMKRKYFRVVAFLRLGSRQGEQTSASEETAGFAVRLDAQMSLENTP